MNCISMISKLGINQKYLDEKQQQTKYKIKYVVEYVRRWLFVSENREKVNRINFIDAMANAGIYKDGDLSTALEVLVLFIESAKQHPCIEYCIFVNDNKYERIKICNAIAQEIISRESVVNVHIHSHCSDVNEYLHNYSVFDPYCAFGSSTILFVDPYDFGTVKLSQVTNFLNRYYCELLFNFFSSDYVRNGIDDRIRKCIGEGDVDIHDKEELVALIVEKLKVGRIEFVFAYRFHTKTNTELYQIIFATPHIRGLEKLKEALWETFYGKEFHRNRNEKQISMFTPEMEKESMLCVHASAAKELLMKRFSGGRADYQTIEFFLIEHTMLQETQCLSNVVKPLIAEGNITKQGLLRKANFKKDEYCFKDVIL